MEVRAGRSEPKGGRSPRSHQPGAGTSPRTMGGRGYWTLKGARRLEVAAGKSQRRRVRPALESGPRMRSQKEQVSGPGWERSSPALRTGPQAPAVFSGQSAGVTTPSP